MTVVGALEIGRRTTTNHHATPALEPVDVLSAGKFEVVDVLPLALVTHGLGFEQALDTSARVLSVRVGSRLLGTGRCEPQYSPILVAVVRSPATSCASGMSCPVPGHKDDARAPTDAGQQKSGLSERHLISKPSVMPRARRLQRHPLALTGKCRQDDVHGHERAVHGDG